MTLVGIGFSLWRAAFLTNKSGKREDTHKAAIDFLSEILETNAINFTQDKKAMDFTFNYYLANVRFRLAELKGGKKDTLGFVFDERLLVKGMLEGDGLKDRWRLYQKAFEDAVNHFKALLSSNRQVP